MTDTPLSTLADIATEAHTKIQQDFQNIDPIIGINRGMRANGIPADAMTIDCLKTGKRIIIVLHDDRPDSLSYQFSFKDQDALDDFSHVSLKQLTSQMMYDWIKGYFSDQ